MSETTDAPAGDTPAPAETVVETPPPIEQVSPELLQETVGEPPKPKSLPQDRRIAQLTKRLNTEAQRAESAERERDAARALLDAGKDEPAPKQPVDVEARAQQIVAQREFERQRDIVAASGVKEFGAEVWNQKTDFLHNMGALKAPGFVEALIELPNATKIVSALADDPDLLSEVLSKSPTAMAAKLGRMDAEMERAVPPKTISAAPRPAAGIPPGGVVVKEIDPWGPEADNLSMAEWNALAMKTDMGKRILRVRR